MTDSLSFILGKFLLACRAEAKSPKTIRTYQDTLADFLKYVGDMPANDLTVDHIRNYVASLPSRPGVHGSFSSHSTHKYFSVVRTFVRWMFDQGYIRSRLMDYVKAPKMSEEIPDALTDEEVDRLFALLKNRSNYRDQVIFELFLDTGLRLNELAELSLDDVNLQENWVKVKGKGLKMALVPIGRTVAAHLSMYIHTQRANTAAPGETALFVKKNGERLGKEGVSTLVKRILSRIRESGKTGSHTLRHTFATRFLRASGNIEVLRRILRHSSITLTQRYVHLQTEDIQAAHRDASPIDHLMSKR